MLNMKTKNDSTETRSRVNHVKSECLDTLDKMLNTTIRGLALGNPSNDELTLMMHMISWVSEIHDYEDEHQGE